MSPCYISHAYKHCLLEIEIDPKQTGQVILDKVLNILGIIEVDFFGLKTKKEDVWLNLRNRVCDEISGCINGCRLRLGVKFFVQPELIQQECTKEQFYLQVKDALAKDHISLSEPDCDESKLSRLVAFIAQAEHGDQIGNSYQREIYENILKEICPSYQPSVLDKIHCEHSSLLTMPHASACYFVLQEVSTLPGYGMEYHKTHTAQCAEIHFGVGPTGLVLHNKRTKVKRILPYTQINLAKHDEKYVHIQLNDDSGTPQSVESFKLVNRKAALSLYRSITEMYYFYLCDTVCPDVKSQYCRDFRGTVVSIFNENSELGKRYMFDIQRTCKEAIDRVQQKMGTSKLSSPGSSPVHGMYSPPSMGEDEEEEEEEDGEDLAICNKNLYKKVKKLQCQLEAIEDSILCCICMFQKVCVVLCPCGHMTCESCSGQIKECPQCRADVEGFQKVFQGFGCAGSQVRRPEEKMV